MIKLKKSNDCKIECFKTKEFNCRSYSYNSVTNQCYLNHHTFETTPKHAIKTDDNIETHEITTCYDGKIQFILFFFSVSKNSTSITKRVIKTYIHT